MTKAPCRFERPGILRVRWCSGVEDGKLDALRHLCSNEFPSIDRNHEHHWCVEEIWFGMWHRQCIAFVFVDIQLSTSLCTNLMQTRFALRVRASYLKPLLMLSGSREKECVNDAGWSWVVGFSLDMWCSLVPFHFARVGGIFDSANFWGHFWCSLEADKPDGINDAGSSWVFGCFLNISRSAVPFHLARAGVIFDSVNIWGHSLRQWTPINLMASTMLAEVEFLDFSSKYHAQLCLFTLRVRASYLTVWTFEATFYAQWKRRNLMASTMLADIQFSFVFF